MMARLAFVTLALAGVAASTLTAQSDAHADHSSHGHSAPADSNFAAMQERGKMAMGVDQYTSAHRFEPLPDGGRIELQMESDDSAAVAQVRRHMREIALAFSGGDFSTPMMVHAGDVPGTKVMAARRALITYTARDLPRGGEVRLTTHDPDALAAVHEFLAFQRDAHHAGK
jgi:hypothetical protein